jgi:hypothetical protein
MPMLSIRLVIAAVVLALVTVAGASVMSQSEGARQAEGKRSAKSARRGKIAAPQRTWKEHWFEHDRVVKLVNFNDEVAVYFDDGVPRDEVTAWILPFMTRAWQYTKATYGQFGGPDARLFSIFHQGRYSGGHPSTYFDASHDHRNVTDCGPGPWGESSVDLPSHELGHIVEGANNGVHGSPAFDVWKDSKWIELYQYDLYIGLGMKDDARRVFDKFTTQSDDFPRHGTHWFRDFFYPAWRDHGRAKLMSSFFGLVARHFPKGREGDRKNQHYIRDMNWGEFIHFMSGAAKKDLRPLARTAFGWPPEWDEQYRKACVEFPGVAYAR